MEFGAKSWIELIQDRFEELGFRNMEIVKLEIFTQVKIHIVFFWL
jgi:hypothetical protein